MPPSMRSTKGIVLPIQVDAAAIRARYVPEVRGMPRYRHFQGNKEASDSDRSLMGNIDKSNFPSELPCLIQPPRQYQILRNRMDDDMPLLTTAAVVKKRRVKKAKDSLPNLKPSNSRIKENGNFSDYVVKKGRIAQTNSTSSEASNKSFYGIRLNDEITTVNRTNLEKPRQNGVILNQPRQSLSVALPQRSKSAQDIQTEFKEGMSGIASTSTFSLRDTKDSATQTVNFPSVKSVEVLENGNAIATQTDAVPLVLGRRKSEAPFSQQDMKKLNRVIDQIDERGALLEIIEDALDETIDKYSRLRTNQIIASSARKQAQIWRDAKDFITTQLLPQSISLANQSRTKKKTAAEIVANIKSYP